jgi:outer membrane murein-binding lipoprotein Lpp
MRKLLFAVTLTAIPLIGCSDADDAGSWTDLCDQPRDRVEQLSNQVEAPAETVFYNHEEESEKAKRNQQRIVELTNLIVNYEECFTHSDVKEAERLRGWGQ